MTNELKRIKRAKIAVAVLCVVLATAGLLVLSQMNQIAEAALITPIQSTTEGEFLDDFSNETYTNSVWTVLSGTWTIENGEYSQNGTSVGYKFSEAGNVDWTDYNISLRMAIQNAKVGAICFRYQDSRNYYCLWVNDANDLTTLYKWIDGSYIAISGNVNFDPGNSYHNYTIHVTGSSMKIWIDGSLRIEQSDSEWSSGKIALKTSRAHVHFDDINVTYIVSRAIAYSINVRAGVTEIVMTCSWTGSGNITIANLTSTATTYYESNMSIYEKSVLSVEATTNVFNIRRTMLSIAKTTSPETWTLYLNVNDVKTYQVGVETS